MVANDNLFSSYFIHHGFGYNVFVIFFYYFSHLYLKNRECFWRGRLSGSSNIGKGVVILFWREGGRTLGEDWKSEKFAGPTLNGLRRSQRSSVESFAWRVRIRIELGLAEGATQDCRVLWLRLMLFTVRTKWPITLSRGEKACTEPRTRHNIYVWCIKNLTPSWWNR